MSDYLPDNVSLATAMGRGFRGRCPHCGEGHLYGRFLKVVPTCEVCGEELHHHRADDFPAYCVMVILGHVYIPLILTVEAAYGWPYWLHLSVWIPLVLLSTLLLLQPVKGAIVGLQWQTGMHGFQQARLARQQAWPGRAAPGSA